MPRQHSVITPADKEELRRELRTRRKSLAPGEQQRLSLTATGKIITSAHWQQAETVALYIAMRGEVDTAPLLVHAWENGKTVLLPACSKKESGKMCFVACSDPNTLCPGPFNIPEPAVSDEYLEFLLITDECGDISATPAQSAGNGRIPPAPDLIIVPGLAFDREGTRLGMGGGYYDRLLALPRYGNSLRLGLAYSFQIVDDLPREDWDVPVHAVCTEKGLLWIHDTPPLPAT